MSDLYNSMGGFHDTGRDLMEHLDRERDQQRRRDNPAIDDLDSICLEIRRFEATLSSEEEIGLILASFAGGSTVMHAERVYRSGPRLLVFEGLDGNGKRVRLVQHHSQVTLMLVAAHKLKDVATRIQIGFQPSSPKTP